MSIDNILAVDTCSSSCSLLLLIDGKRYHRALHHQATHAEQFYAWLIELTQLEANLFERLNVLGLCVGPGRFNGVRVGMTFITTIMSLYKLPTYVCTAHQLLAAKANSKNPIGYALYAKYNHAYWCLSEKWFETQLLTFEQVPVDSVVFGMPHHPALEHHTTLDIAFIEKLILQKKVELVKQYKDIEPLYTANLT